MALPPQIQPPRGRIVPAVVVSTWGHLSSAVEAGSFNIMLNAIDRWINQSINQSTNQVIPTKYELANPFNSQSNQPASQKLK
jgi:hypothetical protein